MAKSSGGGGRAGRRGIRLENTDFLPKPLSGAEQGTLNAIRAGGLGGKGSLIVSSPSILKGTPGFRFSADQLASARSVASLERRGLIKLGKEQPGGNVRATIIGNS